jgi:hypothetical protein
LEQYSTSELLSELLRRGNIPLFPASENDELKINLFKTFCKRLSFWDMFIALNNQLVKKYKRH